jgi:hypothetical protein
VGNPCNRGKQVTTGPAFAFLEHAFGFDEVTETALKRPAVEVEACGLTALLELSNSQSLLMGGEQGSYVIKLLFIKTFWHLCVAIVAFRDSIGLYLSRKPALLSRFVRQPWSAQP